MTFTAIKDPAEVLDYIMDYSREFSRSSPADEIATSSWTVTPEELIIDSDEILAPDKAVVWVSEGGALQTSHKLTNHITTVGGRTYERTVQVTIRNK